MAVTLGDLTTMSQTELDDLFRRSPLGDIPDGDADGTAIVAPGTELDTADPALVTPLARLAGQGRSTVRRATCSTRSDRSDCTWSRPACTSPPAGSTGKPAIILDYSKTSLIAHKVRDEIREVSPGTFLGIVYFGTARRRSTSSCSSAL